MLVSVFMGRPPTLEDFLDDTVTTIRLQPPLRKIILIQATEAVIAA